MKVGRASACLPLIDRTMKLFYIICFVPAFIITLPAAICNAQYVYCNHTVNFTVGSAFDAAEILVFDRLVQDTPQTGFNTSVSPDTSVYGLLQCRGDTTAEQCHNCSRDATTTIRQSQNCGNAVGGRLWLDLCYVRYDNFSFFGELDTFNAWNIFNNYNASSPDVFNAALQDLFINLSAEAANVSNLYASGTTNDSLSREIYALVQCTRDISPDNCTTCLTTAFNGIETEFYGRLGVEYLMGSCIVMYQTYSFVNSPSPAEAPVNPPVANAPQSPPPDQEPANTPVANAPRSPPPDQEPAYTPVVTPSSNSTFSNKILTISGVVGGGLLLGLLACLFTTRRRLKSTIFLRGCQVQEQVKEDTVVSEDLQIVTFKMATLLLATKSFHDDNKVGEGGFGPVYKGTTRDEKEIAVKKLSLNSVQGKEEFLNEVNLVAKIQHRNLVKLLGCCAEGSERLLVYEYLPNKSLDQILFDPIKRKQLDWQQRYNIILGVARGLLYLHHDSHLRIIHRDIKASNILLDSKLNPKISDFGLAKLFPEDDNNSYVRTKVAGTFGYMAPEYAMEGKLTVKADVYSFGVLLLELVTGRKNTDYNLSPGMQILLGWAWRSFEVGNIVEMIDQEIIETCDVGQAARCIHVGMLCTQAEASLRPTMFTANLMLSSDSATLPNPTKPVFYGSSKPVFHGLSDASASNITPDSSLTPVASVFNACAYNSDVVPR